MFRIFLLFFLIVVTGPSRAASPDDAPNDEQYFGPGDRPSVCLERAQSLISPNLVPMTKLAQSLKREKEIDEIGLVRSRDGSRELVFSFRGDVVDPGEKLRSKFTRLFEALPSNFYTPTHFILRDRNVFARPGDYFPGLMIMNSGPWCGGSDEAWKAESEKEYSAGVFRGGPIFYTYSDRDITLERPCSDEAFLTEEAGSCDLKLNKNWAMVFQYMNDSDMGVE